MLCNKCRAGFILLFWLTFCFTLLFCFFLLGGTVSGFMHRHGNVRFIFLFVCFGSYCNSPFCFRASDSYCLWLLDILRTPALNLCRVIVPLSLSSLSLFIIFSFLFSIKIIIFSVVSAGSWYHSSACNHVSLIMFIDFNIKIIKPLAPHADSCVFTLSYTDLFAWLLIEFSIKSSTTGQLDI